jgi:hypothetical protein
MEIVLLSENNTNLYEYSCLFRKDDRQSRRQRHDVKHDDYMSKNQPDNDSITNFTY